MKYLIIIVGSVLFLSGCVRPDSIQTITITDEVATPTATTTTDDTVPEQTPQGGSSAPAEPQKSTTTRSVSIPGRLLLPVLFAQQAPFGNWDELHQEACEEASMIVVDSYFNNTPLDESIMETKIQDIVAWQEEQGYKVDLSAQEMVDVLKSYFNRESRLVTEVTIDRIKYELTQGNLVIVPAAGRELHNPNFKQPGPIYHAVVVVGYDHAGFIVHDVGTRKGKNYHYSFDVFMNAIHDWDHQLAEGGMTDEEMAQGRKTIVVVPANH